MLFSHDSTKPGRKISLLLYFNQGYELGVSTTLIPYKEIITIRSTIVLTEGVPIPVFVSWLRAGAEFLFYIMVLPTQPVLIMMAQSAKSTITP